MRKFLLALLLTSISAVAVANVANKTPLLPAPKLAFTENRGQVIDNDGKLRPDVLFTAENNGVKMYFRKDALSYVFIKTDKEGDDNITNTVYRADVEFLGANPNPRVSAEKATQSLSHFYLGHTLSGVSNVKSYEKIIYHNIYPSIDLAFYTAENGSALKYEFVVHAGGNPDQIKLNYRGFGSLLANREGDIEAKSAFGSITENKPYTFQIEDGLQKEISSGYEVKNGVVTFKLGDFDSSKDLVIDPLTRQWSFNRGGTFLDRVHSNAFDAAGNMLMAGYTASSTFPVTVGVAQTVYGGVNDAIVVSVSPTGSINWATFYGGAGRDQAYSVSTGPNNVVNVVGSTTSTEAGLATAGAFQSAASTSGDGFILQLNSNGIRNWASYYGGNSNDQLNDVATFSNGDVAVVGRTFSTNQISTSGNIAGNRDIYVARITANGANRTWARYFGGTADDQGNTISVDNQGNVVFAGQTTSSGLATGGADQSTIGGTTDAVIGKLNGTSGATEWSTYLGGAQLDIANGITTDLSGNVYVTGLTSSVNLPQLKAIQNGFGGISDAFIAAYSTTGSRLMSSFIGGNATEQGYGVSVIGNYVYLSGASNSSNFSQLIPNPAPVNFTPQSGNKGAFDVFVSKIKTTDFTLSWSVLYGGKADDVSRDLATTSGGRIAFVGYTNSSDFPTLNPINGQASAGTGNDDAIVVSWQDDATPCNPISITLNGSDALCNGTATGLISVDSPTGSEFEYSITTGPVTKAPQSSNIFADVPAGLYTVTVKNTSNGCTFTNSIEIKQPAARVITTKVVNPNCGLGGSITVNVANSGAGDLFFMTVSGPGYDASQITPDNVFTDVSASGVYKVTVLDLNGCEFKAPDVDIVNGNLLATPTATITDASCENINDGLINVTAPKGTGLTYALTGKENRLPQESTRFEGLATGTYMVTAISGSCMSTSQAITINSGNTINLSKTITNNASCSTSFDGSIVVNGPAGMLTPMYSLAGAATVNPQLSNTFEGLQAGNYVVTVTNGENCSGTINVTVGFNNVNLLQFNSSPASCSGQNNGSIKALAPVTGGTLYSLLGNNVNVVNQASPQFNNLAAGPYTLTATTPEGCIYTKNVNVSTPTGLIFTLVKPTASSSCVVQNGSIEVTTSGGSGTVQFELGGPVSKPKQTGNVFNFLPPGSYTVVATDANNCQTTASAVIDGPTGLTLTVTTQQTVCGNGSITVTPSVPGSYSYKLTGAVNRETTAPSPYTFTLLPAGTYTVQVTDANGCTASSPAVVAEGPAGLILNVTENEILCKGGRAKVTVGVTGANNPVSVTMKDNSSGFVYNSPFNSIPPGNYTITAVESITNCSANQLYSVTEPAQLTASAVPTQISCVNNQQSGIITVTANGGTGTKTYLLSGRAESQNTNVFNDVEPGNYTVKITDANGCEVTTNSVTINTVNRVRISSVNTNIPKCNAGKDGSIVINTVDGVAPFKYRIDNGAYSPAVSSRAYAFSNLSAGEHTVDVRDANGCVASQTVTLDEPTKITAVTTGTVPTSCLVGDGSLTINATGGTPPYTYSIDLGSTYQSSNIFDFVFANYFEILIKDANGCIDTTTYTLNNANAPTILNISKQDAACFNEQLGTGQIIIAASAQTPQPLFYSIDDGVTYTATNNGAAVFQNLAAGTYRIRVATDAGCVAFGGPITIDSPKPYLIESVVVTNPFCSNNSPVGGKIEVRVNGGKAPLSYSIDGGLTYQESNLFTGLYPKQEGYSIMVRDANGCIALGSQTRFLTNSSGLTLPIGQPRITQPSCGMNNGSVTISPSGGSGQKKYYLDGVLKATSSGSSYTFANLPEGNYTIKVTDANGCSIETNVTLGTVNFTATTTKATCTPLSQPDGTITVKVDGGSGNYRYSIVSGRYFEFNPTYASQTINTPYSQEPGQWVEEFTFTNLNIGVYEIEVVDLGAPPGQGCTKRMKVVIEGNSGSPVITNVNKVDRICNSASTTGAGNPGSISVFANGASDYLLIGPNNILLQQVSNVFGENPANNLPAGDYYVFAANGNGCFTAYSGNPVTITEPAAIKMTAVNTVQPTCSGTPTGTITIVATGGTGASNLEYSIDGGFNFQSSNTFAGIAAGSTFAANTSIIVRERGTGLGCMVTWPLNIDINNEANFSVINNATTTPQSCDGPADGTATVNVFNGASPFIYTLTPVSGAPIVSNPVGTSTYTFRDLLNGTYQLSVTDANGCTATGPQPIIIQQTISDVSVVAVVDVNTPNTPYACGVNIYDLQFTYSGPETALDISFDGGNSYPSSYQVGLDINGVGNLVDILVPGTYVITIKPVGSNCKIVKNITISDPGTPIEIYSIQITNPSCNGANDGFVRITGRFNDPAGGTLQLGTLTVKSRATAGNFNFTYQNLVAASHTLTVISSGGCTYNGLELALSQPPLISIQGVTITPTSCNGNVANPTPDGQIVISATGATNMDYSIDGGLNFRPGNTFTELTPGDYTVAVRNRDFPNCAFITQTVRVTSATNFNLYTIGINNGAFQASCSSVNDAKIEVVVNNPVNNLTFFLNEVQKAPVLTPLNGQLFVKFLNVIPGTYVVKALDPNGCYDLLTVTLPPTLALSVTSTTVTAPSCNNAADGVIGFTISGGQDAFTTDINQPFGREYSIRNVRTNAVVAPTTLIVSAGTFTFQQENLLAGVYEITVKNKNTICDQVIKTVILNSANTPVVSLQSSSNATQPLCTNGQFTVRTTPAAPGATYSYFTTQVGTYVPAGGQVSRTFSGLQPATYYVRQRTGMNCFSFAGPFTISCGSTRDLGVNFDEKTEVSVYPNPTRGEFSVSFNAEANADATVNLYDMTGKLLSSSDIKTIEGLNETSFNVKDFTAGVYMLKVTIGDRVVTSKVIKD